MSKGPAIIDVQPALDEEQELREVADLMATMERTEKIAERDARKADAAATVAQVTRREADQARLDLGRKLATIRKQWPARGPRAKGWGEFLGRAGIEERTARRLMELAGWVEKVSDPPDPGSEKSDDSSDDNGEGEGEHVPSRRQMAKAKADAREPPPAAAATAPPAEDAPVWVKSMVRSIEALEPLAMEMAEHLEHIRTLVRKHGPVAMSGMHGLMAKVSLLTVRGFLNQLLDGGFQDGE